MIEDTREPPIEPDDYEDCVDCGEPLSPTAIGSLCDECQRREDARFEQYHYERYIRDRRER